MYKRKRSIHCSRLFLGKRMIRCTRRSRTCICRSRQPSVVSLFSLLPLSNSLLYGECTDNRNPRVLAQAGKCRFSFFLCSAPKQLLHGRIRLVVGEIIEGKDAREGDALPDAGC